jgi:hypothetical protein
MFLVPKKHAYEPLFRAFIRLSRLFFINLQSFFSACMLPQVARQRDAV